MEGWNGEGADQVPAVSSGGLLHFFSFWIIFVAFRMGFGEYPKAWFFLLFAGIYPIYVE